MPEARSRAFRLRGVAGALLLGAGGLLAVLSQPLVAEETLADVLTDALAWAAFAGGAALRWWATLYLGGRKERTVVSEGPYSVCRNSLYIGSFLLWLSLALFLKSPILAVAVAMAVVVYCLAVVPAEERDLRRKLGDEYLDYCRQVPRFWPKFARFHTSETILVSVKALVLEARRSAKWIWLPFVAELVAHLRMQPWWPHIFSFC